MGLLQVDQQMEEEVEDAQGQDPRPRFTDSIRNEREGVASTVSQLAKVHLEVWPHSFLGKTKSAKCESCLQERVPWLIGKRPHFGSQILTKRGSEKRNRFGGRHDWCKTELGVQKRPPFFKVDVHLIENSRDIVEVRRRQQLGNGSTGRCRGSLWGKHLCA